MKFKPITRPTRTSLCGLAALLVSLSPATSDVIGFGDDNDMDLLSDEVETNTGIFVSISNTGTDPNDSDSDDDGIDDWSEICLYSTNPNIADTDGGGVPDGDEIAAGTDPLDPADDASDVDSDGDGVPDSQDDFPNDPNETVDSDGDGVGDNADPFDQSDLSPTIIIGDVDTGVANELLDDGSTLADLVQAALTEEPGIADVVGVLVTLMQDGFLSGRELGEVLRTVTD